MFGACDFYVNEKHLGKNVSTERRGLIYQIDQAEVLVLPLKTTSLYACPTYIYGIYSLTYSRISSDKKRADYFFVFFP